MPSRSVFNDFLFCRQSKIGKQKQGKKEDNQIKAHSRLYSTSNKASSKESVITKIQINARTDQIQDYKADFCFFLLKIFVCINSFYLPQLLPKIGNMITTVPMFLGGIYPVYYLFMAKTYLSKVRSLSGFLLSSSLLLMLVEDANQAALSIIITIILSCCFYVVFARVAPSAEGLHLLDAAFLVIVITRLFMYKGEALTWEISLLLEILLLFSFFHFEALKKKILVFRLLCFSLLLLLIYCYFWSVVPGNQIIIVLLLGCAAAGSVEFICLSGEIRGSFFYLIATLPLGFLLHEGVFPIPKVTLAFIGFNIYCFLFVFCASQIKGEKVSTVISDAKVTLYSTYIAALYVLKDEFLCEYIPHLDYWIFCLGVKLLLLLLLQFILEKNDEEKIVNEKANEKEE